MVKTLMCLFSCASLVQAAIFLARIAASVDPAPVQTDTDHFVIGLRMINRDVGSDSGRVKHKRGLTSA